MKLAVDRQVRRVSLCPACGGADHAALGAYAEGFACEGPAGLVHPAYEIHVCQHCGLYFKSDVLSGEALSAYYAALDFAPFNLPFEFPTDRALLAQLRKLPEGSRVLDYGCSTGRLLAALGGGYQRFGVEVNAEAARLAAARGVTIVSDAELDAGAMDAFDAVILTDVFEHLAAPTATLQRLARMLRPGGQLLVVSGLADAIAPTALAAEHWYFRISGHLQMLSLKHLHWLAAALGLSVSAAIRMSHYQRNAPRFAKQAAQAWLYRVVKLTPRSPTAALLRRLPVLRRAASWRCLPATDQFSDHVVAVLTKPEAG